jgi:hypothetical protein
MASYGHRCPSAGYGHEGYLARPMLHSDRMRLCSALLGFDMVGMSAHDYLARLMLHSYDNIS